MQKSKYGLKRIALVPIPWVALHQIGLDPRRDAMQISVRKDRIILEKLEAEESQLCIGDCPHCPGRYSCEGMDE